MKKSLLWLLIVILTVSMVATFSLAGCKGEEVAEEEVAEEEVADVTTITLVRPGSLDKVYAFLGPAIDAFEAENPDIRVNVEYMGWTQWIQTYSARFAAGEQPDVAWWWDDKISDDLVKDLLVPLNDLIDPELKELIPPKYLELTNVDGNILTIPTGLTGLVFFYRKDIFEQAGLDPNRPPQSWDEVLEYAEKIQDNTDATPIGFPGKLGDDTLETHVDFYIEQALGTGMLDENNKPVFNTPEVAEALKFMRKTIDYAQEGWIEYNGGDLRPGFRDGEIAMLFSESTWAIPMLQAKFGVNLDDSPIGIAPPVPGPAGKITYVGADGWAILRDDHLEASAKLLNFLISPEQNGRHNLIYGGTPMYDAELERPEFQYDFWRAFVETLRNYETIQRMGKYHPSAGGLYASLEEIWQKCFTDEMTAEETLNKAEAFVKDYNKQFGIE